jgi:hypothetical protein
MMFIQYAFLLWSSLLLGQLLSPALYFDVKGAVKKFPEM